MKTKRKRLISLIAMATMVATMLPNTIANAIDTKENSVQTSTTQAQPVTETVERKVVTYFPEWAYTREQNDYYTADRMPWDKITHINYAFAHVGDDNKIAIGDKVAALEAELPGQTDDFPYKGHFNVLNSYKKKYPNVKTMISVGGWADSTGFYKMTQTEEGMVTFADSVVKFLRDYGFNGVDIDYEYPTSLEDAGNPKDFDLAKPYRKNLYTQYVKMMKILREKVNEASKEDGKEYLLTAAVTASGWVVGGMGEEDYTKYLDFLNLMTYDFHGSWNGYVAHNSPLYSDPRDPEVAGIKYNYLSTDWAVKYYAGVMDPSKIVVGIPLYTRGWENVTPSVYGYPGGLYGTACNGKPDENEGFGATGINNIWCDYLEDGSEEPGGSNPLWHVKNLLADKSLGYERFWDDVSKVPYVWNEKDKVFLSFEDEQSMNEKMDYIVENGLGGAMFWEVDGDYDVDENGKYVIGDTLTTIAHDKLEEAGPLKVTQKVNDKEVLDYDMELVNNFDHPYNSYSIKFINNTGTTLKKPYTLEFDLPNSIAFKTDPYVSGAKVQVEDRGLNKHITITATDVFSQDLAPGSTELMSGDMTLKPFSGPKNMVFNGCASKEEIERNEKAVDIKAATVLTSTSDSRDGNYTVNVSVPANSNGNTVTLYEGDKAVKTVSLTNAAKTFSYNVKGNPNGDYYYKAVVSSGKYEIASNTAAVYVGPAIDLKEAKVSLSVVGSTTGAYTVKVDVPANSNATSLELYENGNLIKEETVNNSQKIFTYDITGKATGLYTYKVVTKNRALTKTSNPTTIKVDVDNNVPQYNSSTVYHNGDKVVYNGKVYKFNADGYSGLAPDVFTNLWECIGDYKEPSSIDLLDVAILAEKYNSVKGSDIYNEQYDLNSDSIIDLYDLVLLSKNL